MKLQISFDLTNLPQAISTARATVDIADILDIGTLLLYNEGINAITEFKKEFPNKLIFVDAKICDKAKESIELIARAGADIISVLAGTSNKTIFEATQVAHSNNAKIALDLVDAYSMAESCFDAKKLGVDIILFHRSHEEAQATSLMDQWDNVRGNTDLPIFISGRINRTNIEKILFLKPQGVIIGSGITKSDDPIGEATYFNSIIKGKI